MTTSPKAYWWSFAGVKLEDLHKYLRYTPGDFIVEVPTPTQVRMRLAPGVSASVVRDLRRGTDLTIHPCDTLTIDLSGPAEASPSSPQKKKKKTEYGMSEIEFAPLSDEEIAAAEAEYLHKVAETVRNLQDDINQALAVSPVAAGATREVGLSGEQAEQLPDTIDDCETLLFAKREQVEVLWLDIGKLCAHIVDQKLYKQAQDSNGNHFRTAKSYFEDLDRRFHERGLNIGRTTMNRFMADYRLFIEGESGVKLTPEEAITVGKSNLEALAPAVRKLKKEGKTAEAATLVRDVVESAVANGGLPTAEVNAAVDEYTDRVMKGLEAQFSNGAFGKRLSKLVLWWGGAPRDLLSAELTEEQAAWVMRRLGIKPGNLP